MELVTVYLEDALDEPARLGMEQHLACCGECGHRLDQFRAVIGVLGALPSEEDLRGDVRDRLLSAFRDRHRRGA
ncbi:zf-HC2 domain-containing protein [Planobispora rosea]|uniref:zf-HC2 domain-containing protein n=1 Tax=Planobispora rosea TaxID=35762 RepID=UPI001E4F9E27|nr:zf-HC2 domain-containing protein [Planobispora rosea]